MHFLHAYLKSLDTEVMIVAAYYPEPFEETQDIKGIGSAIYSMQTWQQSQ